MQESYLMYSDIEGNSNKTLYIKVDGVTLHSSWGRVGDSLQTKSWTYITPQLAEKHYHRKIQEKLRKGYELVDVAGQSPNSKDLALLAAQEIDVDSEDTRKLIKWLTEQNIHQICENTTIRYNSSEGLFTTPIGVVVSQSTIDKARNKLASIEKLLESNTPDTSLLTTEANAYLRLIPQNLGRARKKLDLNNIFVGEGKISKQVDILDSLEASLLSLLTGPASPGTIKEKVFECKIHLVKDPQIIKEVETKYRSSNKSMHVSSTLKLKSVYTLDIPSIRSAWESDGSKLNNIMRLWHGTKCHNVLSILKRGLVSSGEIGSVNGSNYGHGIYFSDISTKSLNYSTSFWGGSDSSRPMMFLADVAMGNYYVPKSSYDGPFPKIGYDSIFAKSGKSGVQNNEMIVPRSSQVNLIYLCEFSR